MGAPFGIAASKIRAKWRRWPKATVAIIGSGPSLTKEDVALIGRWRRQGRGQRRVIVVNNNWQIAPWADVLYACDYNWWALHAAAVAEGFAGECWTQGAVQAEEFGLNRAPSCEAKGFSLTPPLIHTGNNGGYQAINLAIHFGARRIVLSGFDMCEGPNGEAHWHGLHGNGLTDPPPDTLAMWRRNFDTTPPDLKRAKVEVVNASRRTALTCYPRMELEHALS